MKAPTWSEIKAACATVWGGQKLYHDLREAVARGRVDAALEEMRAAAEVESAEQRWGDFLARMERFDRAVDRLDAADAAWQREIEARRLAR